MTKHQLNILGFILNCTLIAFFFHDSAMMWVLLGCASLLFLFFLALGIVLPNRQYFVRTYTKLRTPEVLLTFDDGPDKDLTPVVLDILKKHHVTALFFVIGEKATANQDLIDRMLAEGHQLGNHTQSHNVFFATLGQDKVNREIGMCDNSLILMGVRPGNYFRPPVGYTNPRIARAISKYKKKVIGWSLRSYDSVLKEESKLLQRLNSKVKPGQIVLLHDNLPHSVAILDAFITEAKKNGIKFANPSVLKSFVK